jgi:ribonuclease T1
MAAVLRFVLALLLAALFGAAHAAGKDVDAASLPPEARETLRLIDAGGPFPYKRDGVVFANHEHRLPEKPRGYWHEYTVPTPGARNRGARRIIAGDGGERYYTGDHYRSFRRIRQ